MGNAIVEALLLTKPRPFGLLGALQTEDKLRQWAQPPSPTEREKCERTERMVREAIDAHPVLSKLDVTVFVKGSYGNRTNIPAESDVDVGVRNNGLYLNQYPEGMGDSDFGFVPASLSMTAFTEYVFEALQNKFGVLSVSKGKKSIKVRSSTARVDADVSTHAIHRQYDLSGNYEKGVALKCSDGTVIYNWPDQHYANGVDKNERTGKRFKGVTRILKRMRSEIIDAGGIEFKSLPPYLLECLLWNVPDDKFSDVLLKTAVSECLSYLEAMLRLPIYAYDWKEINGMKPLFGQGQPWTINSALDLVSILRRFLETV